MHLASDIALVIGDCWLVNVMMLCYDVMLGWQLGTWHRYKSIRSADGKYKLKIPVKSIGSSQSHSPPPLCGQNTNDI